jgi:hypothetical protein
MRSIGIYELFYLLLIWAGIILVQRVLGMRPPGPMLVLHRFLVDQSSPAGLLVDVAGRASGFIGLMLAIFDMEAETTFVVKAGEIRLDIASVGGQTHHVVPLPSVSSVHCGLYRPVEALIIGVLLGLFTLPALAGGVSVAGIVLVVFAVACVV